MADPFALLRPKRPAPPPPMAKPSVFDRFMGRGKYMKEYASRRGEIFDEFRVEKRRTHKRLKRQGDKYLDKLEEGDLKAYQHFNIRTSQRWTRTGLDKEKRERLERQEMRKVDKQLRRNEREAVRELERERDKKIRSMRDTLLDRTTAVTDEPGMTASGGNQQRPAA